MGGLKSNEMFSEGTLLKKKPSHRVRGIPFHNKKNGVRFSQNLALEYSWIPSKDLNFLIFFEVACLYINIFYKKNSATRIVFPTLVQN